MDVVVKKVQHDLLKSNLGKFKNVGVKVIYFQVLKFKKLDTHTFI